MRLFQPSSEDFVRPEEGRRRGESTRQIESYLTRAKTITVTTEFSAHHPGVFERFSFGWKQSRRKSGVWRSARRRPRVCGRRRLNPASSQRLCNLRTGWMNDGINEYWSNLKSKWMNVEAICTPNEWINKWINELMSMPLEEWMNKCWCSQNKTTRVGKILI